MDSELRFQPEEGSVTEWTHGHWVPKPFLIHTYDLHAFHVRAGRQRVQEKVGLTAGELWWGPSCEHLLCLVSCSCSTSFYLWTLTRCALTPFSFLSYTHIQSQGKAEVQLCRFLIQSVCLCLSDWGKNLYLDFDLWLRMRGFLTYLKKKLCHPWLVEWDRYLWGEVGLPARGEAPLNSSMICPGKKVSGNLSNHPGDS